MNLISKSHVNLVKKTENIQTVSDWLTHYDVTKK